MPALRHRAWLFDLDGTLVDTAPDIADAVNAALTRHGLPNWPQARIRDWVGHGARVMLERALAASASDHPVEPLLETFAAHYQQHLAVRSQPYPHVRAVLAELRRRGARLAVVTNKLERFARPLLERLDLAPAFDAIVSGDSTARGKPDPAPVLLALQQLGATVAEAAMVGDSAADVGAARAAGIPVYAVTFGYNHGRPVAELAPDRLLDSFADLPLDA